MHCLMNLKKCEDRYQPLLNKINKRYMQDPNNDNDLTGLLELSEEVEYSSQATRSPFKHGTKSDGFAMRQKKYNSFEMLK